MHAFKSTLVQIEEDVLARFDDEIIPAIAGTNILINNVWYRITEVALYCEIYPFGKRGAPLRLYQSRQLCGFNKWEPKKK